MKKKLQIIQKCPRCSSLKTGIISNCVTTQSEKKRIKKKYFKQGCFVKFVSPEKYRTYYLPQKVFYFCDECDYEFRGEEHTERVELEEYYSYLEEREIQVELSMYQKNIFHSILKRTKEK